MPTLKGRNLVRRDYQAATLLYKDENKGFKQQDGLVVTLKIKELTIKIFTNNKTQKVSDIGRNELIINQKANDHFDLSKISKIVKEDKKACVDHASSITC